MPKLVHKHVPDTTLVVTDEVAESMRGSWDVEQAEKPKKSATAKK